MMAELFVTDHPDMYEKSGDTDIYTTSLESILNVEDFFQDSLLHGNITDITIEANTFEHYQGYNNMVSKALLVILNLIDEDGTITIYTNNKEYIKGNIQARDQQDQINTDNIIISDALPNGILKRDLTNL